MNKKKSIARNYIYNLSLTMLNMLFPLITAPYISRVLGADNLGKFNFANAVATWFMIIAAFGIPTYGIREIARVREDKAKLSKVFSELITVQLIFTIIAEILYITLVLSNLRMRNEVNIFLITGVSLFLNILSIDWFYQGIEEYGYITLRSLILKLISLVLIFLLISKKDDYLIYAAINVFALSFGNILNYFNSRKFAEIKLTKINIMNHIKKLKVFFLSALIISIYTQLDQVILGFFSSPSSLAFYSRSKQITSIGLSLTLALSTVLIPRISYLYENNKAEYKAMLDKSINYNYIIALPCVVGIFSLSKEIMWLFGGNEFIQGSLTLAIISLTIVVISLGTWQFNQIFVPSGREKDGVKIQVIMAIISVLLNLVLIPRFNHDGAAVSLLLTETIGTFAGFLYIRKTVKINYFTISLLKYIISSICMLIFILICKKAIDNSTTVLFISIIFSPVIYGILLVLFKDNTIMDIIKSIRNKFDNHKNKINN